MPVDKARNQLKYIDTVNLFIIISLINRTDVLANYWVCRCQKRVVIIGAINKQMEVQEKSVFVKLV